MDNKDDISNFNLGIAKFATVTGDEQQEIMEDTCVYCDKRNLTCQLYP